MFRAYAYAVEYLSPATRRRSPLRARDNAFTDFPAMSYLAEPAAPSRPLYLPPSRSLSRSPSFYPADIETSSYGGSWVWVHDNNASGETDIDSPAEAGPD